MDFERLVGVVRSSSMIFSRRFSQPTNSGTSSSVVMINGLASSSSCWPIQIPEHHCSPLPSRDGAWIVGIELNPSLLFLTLREEAPAPYHLPLLPRSPGCPSSRKPNLSLQRSNSLFHPSLITPDTPQQRRSSRRRRKNVCPIHLAVSVRRTSPLANLFSFLVVDNG